MRNIKIENHLLSLVWLIFLIFPNNQIFFLLVPFLFLILFRFNPRVFTTIRGFTFSFVLILLLSVILNANELYFEFKDLARTLVFILTFICFGNIKGNKILSSYIYIAVGYLVLSQFAGIVNFTPFTNLIDAYYLKDEGISAIEASSRFEISEYGVFRLGGIFINPNQYARFLELVLLIILCEIKQFSKRNFFILVSIIIFSLIATGSRTSLIVLVLTIVYFLFSSKTFTLNKSIFIACTIVLLGGLFFTYFETENLRVLKVDEGFDNSLGAKFQLLEKYLISEVSFLTLLFGNSTLNSFGSYTGIHIAGMDFEIGNLLLNYGVLFIIVLITFYIKIFKTLTVQYKILFIILLWMFSSSILLSYRMAAIWLLVLSVYYQRSLNEMNYENKY